MRDHCSSVKSLGYRLVLIPHYTGEKSLIGQTLSRAKGSRGFVLLPKRWVVERSLAWLGRYRRNSKDYERLTESSASMLQISMIQLMLHRLRPS